ncbi:hypothetical protein [Trinickia dinghuensis]|uniref:Uncharacterized protein n=1 Tax=Trinickia dinghuensis TaxID=2291023 RepID=A0A3D8K505_9BURK|nr:hypothetical protein [Trinickia dinghuensis]RDV00514.1 hypothetical protein DWV00_01675 [Trinickia dinghuensis]
MLTVAVAAGIGCALAAGCDGGHDDLDAQSSAAAAAPMLPGTRGAATPAGAGAQRFDTGDDSPAATLVAASTPSIAAADGTLPQAASDALQPRVMRRADWN